MTKTLLFTNNVDDKFFLRTGETLEYYRACYFKGKSLGYEDGNVYAKWPKTVLYDLKRYPCPKESILPIKYIEDKDIHESEYTEVINLSNKNTLFEGSESLWKNGIRGNMSYFGFFNKYYAETGIRPVFNIKIPPLYNNMGKYILVHIRELFHSAWRNVEEPLVIKIMNIFRNYYPEYDIYIAGDNVDKYSSFGNIVKYFDNWNDIIKLVGNASFAVSGNCGINAFIFGLGIPHLEMSVSKSFKPSKGDLFSEEYYTDVVKMIGGKKIGKGIYDWVDKEKFKYIYKNEYFNRKDILSYFDRWLKL